MVGPHADGVRAAHRLRGRIPAGDATWLTESIHLRCGCDLFLQHTAVLVSRRALVNRADQHRPVNIRLAFRKRARSSVAEFVVEADAHDIVGELGVPADYSAEVIRYAATFRSQIEIKILSLPSPVARKRAFDAAAQGPAGLGGRLAECKRSTGITGRNAADTNDTHRKAYVGSTAS